MTATEALAKAIQPGMFASPFLRPLQPVPKAVLQPPGAARFKMLSPMAGQAAIVRVQPAFRREINVQAMIAPPPAPAPPAATSALGKPVLQLSSLPIPITPSLFANALSNANPGGDQRSLYAFRQLVDPVPGFERYYQPSGASTETTYKLVVQNASAGASPFTEAVIASAIEKFADTSFPAMDGTPGTWAPVYADPPDWYDTTRLNRFVDLNLDLTAAAAGTSPFTVLPGAANIVLSGGGSTSAVDANSALHSVTMKYMPVMLDRPWFVFDVFKTAGWTLSAQPAGFCSTGDVSVNAGVLPLLPCAVLLGANVTVQANWTLRDKAYLNSATAMRRTAYLGPFALNRNAPTAAAPTLQVIGFVSNVVPLSPQTKG